MLQSDETSRGLNENFILHCRTVMVGLGPKKYQTLVIPIYDSLLWTNR